MKKTIFFLLAILFASAFSSASAKAFGDTTTNAKSVRTLIVNADVTVVLVNNENALLEVAGNKWLRKQVAFKSNSDTLTIDQTGSDDLKGEGVIYVPAASLGHIQLNGQVQLRSFDRLETPALDVSVNNYCYVLLNHAGKLTVSGKYAGAAEQRTQKIYWPSNLSRQSGQAFN